MKIVRHIGPTQIFSLIGRGGMHLAAILLFVSMLAIVLHSIVRYVFGGGIHIVIEAAPYIMLYLVFLGLAGTQMARGHVHVDLLLPYLSKKTRHLLYKFFVLPLSVIYVVAILYTGYLQTVDVWKSGNTTTGATPILLGPMAIIVPIGSAMLLLVLLAELVTSWLGLKPKHEEGQEGITRLD